MENQNIGLISLLNGIMNHNVIIRTELINIPLNHPLQPNQGCSEEFINSLGIEHKNFSQDLLNEKIYKNFKNIISES